MTDKTVNSSRRGFLKGATLGIGVAAVAAAAPEAAKAEILEERRDDDSYRETEHVKTYYELARF